jgi:NADH-quinone oxidoreductase subunit J
MLNIILFFVLAVICLAGAVNLLMQTHPISSALSLIVVMMSLAMLYMLLGAEFVAVIQVIVYAGAIMVLFVFVIMLLNAGAEERTKGSKVALMIGVPGLLIGAGITAWVLATKTIGTGQVQVGQLHGSAQSIGRLLFRDFLLPFEVTSVLILIAIMGAVVLARRSE